MTNGIGVLIPYRKNIDIEAEFNKAIDMEITSCQINIWDESLYNDENAAAINKAVEKTGFKIPTAICRCSSTPPRSPPAQRRRGSSPSPGICR